MEARKRFEADWSRTDVLEIDPATCAAAAEIAEGAGARTLDALHLAAASRVEPRLRLLTYDRHQAAAARSLGLTVLGAE